MSSDEQLPLNISTINGASQRHPFFTWTAAQIRETAICVVFSIAGWNLPEMLFYPTAAQIDSRPIPGQHLASGEFLKDIRYSNPLVHPATVDAFMLKMTGLWIPLFLVIAVEFCRRKTNPHRILCALLSTIGISEFFTNVLKFWVRRPRPNYYALCGFKEGTCTHSFQHTVQAQLSFPSGHTSLSFCTWTVVALWFFHLVLTGSTKTAPPKWKLFLSCVLPWGWATFVAVSRIVDYWHHPSDILAGFVLGTSCATMCFLIHFHPSMNNRMLDTANVIAGGSSKVSFHE